MTFERSEFERLQKNARLKQAAAMLPNLQMLKQAAVSAESLTGVPAWDTFLQYLQGAIETTREQLDKLQVMLSSPDILEQSALLRIKVNALRCAERIAAWEAVIGLPKELIENGNKAESLLSRMEKLDGDDRRSDGEA